MQFQKIIESIAYSTDRIMFNTKCLIMFRRFLPTHILNNVNNAKYICTSSLRKSANYYETLGITKNSTQNEIKSAYYRLSMQYHPDKNKGCEISAKKFREISQAYEVLGTYRLRRLYDKGVIYTAEATHARPTEDEIEVEDDPETKFYKSRFKKSQVSDEMGRTPIYDFDEWSRSHYTKSFQRRKDAKARFERKQTQERESVLILQKEITLFGFIFLGVALFSIFCSESSLDAPKERSIRASSERNIRNDKSILKKSPPTET